MRFRKHKRGFTLIEVMLVLVILGGLATLAIYAFTGRQEKANIDTTKILMDKVLGYLDEYKLYVGRYPTDNDGGLRALVTKPDFDTPALAEKWCKLAEPKQLRDTWGNDFRYDLDEDEKPRLKSNGPDGEVDSEDDIIRPVKEEDQ